MPDYPTVLRSRVTASYWLTLPIRVRAAEWTFTSSRLPADSPSVSLSTAPGTPRLIFRRTAARLFSARIAAAVAFTRFLRSAVTRAYWRAGDFDPGFLRTAPR